MSSLSAVMPSARSQSRACTSVAVMSVTIRRPQLRPAQILRPAPNGMSSKSLPLTSTPACEPPGRKRAGRNSRGSGHASGSRAIAHTFTSSVVPAGMRNPSTSHSSAATRGSDSGVDGCRRNVSLITAVRYVRRGRSDSETRRSRPTTASSSCWAFLSTSGCRISSASAHSTVLDVVSVPAVKRFCCHDMATESISVHVRKQDPKLQLPSTTGRGQLQFAIKVQYKACPRHCRQSLRSYGKGKLTRRSALMSVSLNLVSSPSASGCCSRILASSTLSRSLPSSAAFLSLMIPFIMSSYLRCSRFILPTTPCGSSHASAGTKSPTLKTPASCISSTTISLNSLAPSPPSTANTRRPTVARASVLVAQTLATWPSATAARPRSPCRASSLTMSATSPSLTPRRSSRALAEKRWSAHSFRSARHREPYGANTRSW
uniref:Uncharacterized protein n=1 Tax=Zea mays TaxID=4577 RepID=A0A804PKW3_MAIZE